MLKKRLIGSINIKDRWAVQSIGFQKYLPIGNPKYSVKYLDKWGVDEIVIHDISATVNDVFPSFTFLNDITKEASIPVTYGGGINSVKKMIKILQCGVDKICINQSAINNNNIISEASKILGRQCVVISIDIILNNNKPEVFDYCQKKSTGFGLINFARRVEDLGAGELIIRNIEYDGMKCGYDIISIKEVFDNVGIPIIASGGYGNPKHALDCFKKTKISGISIGNSLTYFEHSAAIIKSSLNHKDFSIRNETAFKYSKSSIGIDGRLQKFEDKYLENLIFKKVPEVKI